MHLNRFTTRLALALVVATLVVFAHARHHIQLLEVLAGAGLVLWAVFEAQRAARRRR